MNWTQACRVRKGCIVSRCFSVDVGWSPITNIQHARGISLIGQIEVACAILLTTCVRCDVGILDKIRWRTRVSLSDIGTLCHRLRYTVCVRVERLHIPSRQERGSIERNDFSLICLECWCFMETSSNKPPLSNPRSHASDQVVKHASLEKRCIHFSLSDADGHEVQRESAVGHTPAVLHRFNMIRITPLRMPSGIMNLLRFFDFRSADCVSFDPSAVASIT